MKSMIMGLPLLRETPYKPRRQRRTKLPLTIVATILIVLYLQFSVLPRYISQPLPESVEISRLHLERLNAGLQKCSEFNTPAKQYTTPTAARANPRWNPSSGQNDTVLLQHATLFDGENFVSEPVDIEFKKGIIISVSPASKSPAEIEGVKVINMEGKYVTPGLIDMHSHHLVGTWPGVRATDDVNEMNPKAFGPLTPFVRAVDSIHAYDIATTIIASGGVTSSLLLPGSANIMGGEGFLVKNVLNSGKDGEEVVEEILFEHGVPMLDRRRYMKMACGENPSRVYDHTRMGNAWIFRKQMAEAEDLRQKQDMWCKSAAAIKKGGDASAIAAFTAGGGLPEALELETSVAMLRGKIGVNIHCYETEDFEDMIRHSKEFDFRIQAFHHALEAWKVPEMIKDTGYNTTIATFSSFGLYKKEAYEANLWAGKILAEHGVPIAYKSDHGMESTNAKYLLFQAATGHSFGLPEPLALRSVTSVPAKSLEVDHRVGYVRVGYDADIVVWDSHPLSVGATPLQVYIDGKATLNPTKVKNSLSKVTSESIGGKKPTMRKALTEEARQEVCKSVETEGRLVIMGITKSYLESPHIVSSASGNFTAVIENGKIVCFGPHEECLVASAGGTFLHIESGHILPGLTAVSTHLGLTEIDTDSDTGDGGVSNKVNVLDPENLVYAKYGIHLEGKAFDRAKIAGITRAISPPMSGDGESTEGFLRGVSVGFKTSGKKTTLNGGIFQDDVALHINIGQAAKSTEATPTISSAIAKLRKLLNISKGNDNLYGKVANGSFPLVVHVENKYDIMQLIKIKQDYPIVNLVLMGGSGIPHVAEELATAKIPVILTSARGAPDTFEKRDSMTGPPLTKSPAEILTDAGVTYALAIAGFSESFIHNLPLEASWAAKYAGLSGHAAVNLVSRNVEKILDLKIDEKSRDFVVYEGDPLEFGASVVLAIDGQDKRVMTCWPQAQ